MGASYVKLGKIEEAKKDFQKSLELDSNNDFTFFELGKIYQTEKKDDEAIDMFTKSIQINPQNAWAYNRRGEVYAWGLMDKKAALKDFEKAIELDTDFPFPYKNRGYINYFSNDFEKAIVDLDKAYELDPDPHGNGFRVLFAKGKARIQVKDFKKGFEDLKESVFYLEVNLKYGNDSFLEEMLKEAYYLCAYSAGILSLKEENEYLKKGCEMGVKECCSILEKKKK